MAPRPNSYPNYIYMRVTADEYELPVAIADSAWKLAQICGTAVSAIMYGIRNREEHGRFSVYVRVKVKEEET